MTIQPVNTNIKSYCNGEHQNENLPYKLNYCIRRIMNKYHPSDIVNTTRNISDNINNKSTP